MILYHGTSSEHLPKILEQGILPCCESGRGSNWDGDVTSKPDLVYLTSCYPVYFALHAIEEPHEMVVVQVEVPLGDLFPDEDFIACNLRDNHGMLRDRMPLSKVNTLVDPREYKKHAELSLSHNGVVSIARVGVEQILGHEFVRHMSTAMFIGGDSMPIPLNHMILGEHYGRCIKALFSGGEEAALKVATSTKNLFGLENDERYEQRDRACEASGDASP